MRGGIFCCLFLDHMAAELNSSKTDFPTKFGSGSIFRFHISLILTRSQDLSVIKFTTRQDRSTASLSLLL